MENRPSTKIILVCKVCDRCFEAQHWQVQQGRKYCSRACFRKDHVEWIKPALAARSQKAEERREVRKCANCGKDFTVALWEQRTHQGIGKRFCSPACGFVNRRDEFGDDQKARAKEWRLRLRQEMIAAYGGKCACCGEHREAFLTLDHVGGRTPENHPWPKMAGTGIYTKLKKLGWPQTIYRCLCYNCNCAMARGNSCPHDSERRNL